MSKKFVVVLMLLCCLIGVSQGQSIIWVSDCITETEPHDQGFVDILEAQGYTVTRLEGQQTLDQAKVDQMNAVDLVIVGRHGNSGAYASNAAEVKLWNSITTPLIQQNGYLPRNNRWKWLDSGSTFNTSYDLVAVDASDPVFQFVELDETQTVDICQAGVITIVPVTDVGNGTLIAKRDDEAAPYAWIVRWETNQEFYPGSGEFAAGPRMYFASGESGGAGDGTMNLTPQGQLIFLNAVYQMSGATFNRTPLVAAGADKVNWVGTDLQLAATVIDDGLPEPANVTVSWVKISGPGNVTFSATDIVDPIVSFDTVGTYELELTGTDGDKTASDVMVVTVADPADNKLVALWSFDSMASTPGVTVADDAGNHDGTFVGAADDLLTPALVEDPNIITPGWVGAQALDFYGDSWVEITPDVADPNAFDLQTGVTMSAWVRGDGEFLGDYSGIISKGEQSYRLSAASAGIDGRVHFKVQGTTARIDSVRSIHDGQWHHIAATYDAVTEKACLYIDGVLDTEQDASGLIGLTASPLWLGDNPDRPERIWNGGLDDLRVYNYGISATDVETLASMAPRVPGVNAGEDVEYKRNAAGLTLTGIVTDDENPVAATIAWSVVTKPEAAADPVFTPVNAVETVVKFSSPGTYVLQLSADDTLATITDDVVITVTDPTCQDVIDAGLLMAGDINEDCYVNLEDFALMAADWLRCNNPQDSTCEWPFE
ncbi:MAG: LamG domain-containing protein [Phycisphaerae bacterium]|nr:LamG domain-containing protein [Phycisphaerae bacterium]